ncbi:MAG: hypothetical protein WC637_21625 [Victivallales bacterium]
MNRFIVAIIISGIFATASSVGAEEEKAANDSESHGTLHKIVLYLPNRVLDVFDIARLRLRVGPGVAVDARVTEIASAFVGSYASVYAGLPGPRNRPMPKLPLGFESRSGVQASVIDASAAGGVGPDYGPAEIGAGLQILIIGLDIGVDPFEMADLLTGFFLVDLRNDDL